MLLEIVWAVIVKDAGKLALHFASAHRTECDSVAAGMPNAIVLPSLAFFDAVKPDPEPEDYRLGDMYDGPVRT